MGVKGGGEEDEDRTKKTEFKVNLCNPARPCLKIKTKRN